MFGCLSYSFIISHIIGIINVSKKQANLLSDKLNNLDKLNEKYNIPCVIYEKIQRFILNQKVSAVSLDKFTSSLPESLQNEITYYTYLPIIEKIPFLKNKHKDFLKVFLPRLTLKYYESNEVIYEKYKDSEFIYFILNGSAKS